MRIPSTSWMAFALPLLAISGCVAEAAGQKTPPSLVAACQGDIDRFCGSGVKLRAARECLRENISQVSQECRAAVRLARSDRQQNAGQSSGSGADNEDAGAGSDASALPPTRADVIYATPPAGVAASHLSLDYYDVPGSPDAPLVVFVHGGAWQMGDKRGGERGQPAAFRAAGYAYASVNYRMIEFGPPDLAAADIAAAVAFLRANAKAYGFNPDRIALMGHSAGAHLAALVALDARYLTAAGVPASAVRTTVLLDGAGYDIETQVAQGGNAELYRGVFGNDKSYWKKMSPLTYAKRAAPPASILHHVEGRAASKAQAEALAAALRAGGGTALTHEAKGETHASINRGFGEAGDETTRLSLEFLSRHLEGS